MRIRYHLSQLGTQTELQNVFFQHRLHTNLQDGPTLKTLRDSTHSLVQMLLTIFGRNTALPQSKIIQIIFYFYKAADEGSQ